MNEDLAKLLISEIKKAGINFMVCLPDSRLHEIYLLGRGDPHFQFVPATNEGEGVAIAAGAWLGGKKSIMVMEGSGLRVASEALARLGIDIGIPVLMLMSYRGCIGDGNWWAVNQGVVMEPLLKALRIPYCLIEKEQDIEGVIRRAVRTIEASKYHVAILISGDILW